MKRRRGVQRPDPVREARAKSQMIEEECRLDGDQRAVVESTVEDHCRIRCWTLHAVSCRSNHVHVVVSGDKHPNDVRDEFKSWCTRRLKALDVERATNDAPTVRERWWSERGSCRYINRIDDLEAAILYVKEAQDRPRGDG